MTESDEHKSRSSSRQRGSSSGGDESSRHHSGSSDKHHHGSSSKKHHSSSSSSSHRHRSSDKSKSSDSLDGASSHSSSGKKKSSSKSKSSSSHRHHHDDTSKSDATKSTKSSSHSGSKSVSSKSSKHSSSSKHSRSSKHKSSSRAPKDVHESSCPMPLTEVWEREEASKALIKKRNSCVRRGKKHDKKSVRFATDESTDKVWCTVKEFEKETQALVDSLFWTKEELYDTYKDDQNVISVVEPQYFKALRSAYKSSLQQGSDSVEMDDEAMAMCSSARGLEMDAFPYLRDFAKRHSQEVLAIQDISRNEGRKVMSDDDLELMRQTSIRYSKGNRLVATRMAQFDNKDSHYSFKSGGTIDD